MQRAEVEWWWAHARYRVPAAVKLRGVQQVGARPIVTGWPKLEVTDCHLGDDVRIHSGHRKTLISGWGRLRIGNRCFINAGTVLFSVLEIVIGDAVALANEVYVCDTNSHGVEGADPVDAPVHIGSGTWVGARAMILPGVTIGRRVLVAAGSIVTRDVPDDALVAGNPARVVRTLDYPPGCERAWHDAWCSCPAKDTVMRSGRVQAPEAVPGALRTR